MSSASGAAILRAAGIEESDPAKLKSEFLEIVRQALSGSGAGAWRARLERETLCEAGRRIGRTPAQGSWIGARRISKPPGCRRRFRSPSSRAADATAARSRRSRRPKSKNFDLLLDVELPVSVSFGRAQVALKDVLKLTTGSIVELNRDIGDPVEVIVNNCVIARGEVVVVEGNFGVRIQQVISRQERLRTLK